MLRTCHLFAGAGGGLLADLILGHKPVVAVEWDAHACRVLRERADEGWFPGLHVWEGDVRLFDPSEYSGRVDCIAAGFPCQDISAAGKGAGITGARSGLVREVFRAIDAIRPSFVFLENSPRIRTRGRDVVIGELVARGYAWRDGVIAASDVGAPHQRDRWWCLAANADGQRKLESQRSQQNKWRWDCDGAPKSDANADVRQFDPSHETIRARRYAADDGYIVASNTLRDRLEIAIQRGGLRPADANAIEAAARHTGAFDWSPPDAGVCRVVDGLASTLDEKREMNRAHRIQCAGNGQIPLQAAAAWIKLGGPLT